MKSTPSLLALLGLVAVAGYQNRDKISSMIDDARQRHPGAPADSQPGLLAGIGDLFRSGSNGAGALSGGLGELFERLTSAGHGNAAQSWVSSGPNLPVPDHDLARAIGDDTLDELAVKTGLPRAELIRRLSAAMPEVVNRLTPDGRLPSPEEAARLL